MALQGRDKKGKGGGKEERGGRRGKRGGRKGKRGGEVVTGLLSWNTVNLGR